MMKRLIPANTLMANFLCTALFCLPFILASQPTATYTADKQKGCAPLLINFSNQSINASQYLWDFGNGTQSTLVNPSVLFSNPGQYTIRLIATDALGNSDTLIRVNEIQVNAQPNANFNFQLINSCLNQNQVQFSSLSGSGLQHYWSFGDGTSSNLEHPIHSYANTGNYIVSHHVNDSIGCQSTQVASQPIQIYPGPQVSIQVSDTLLCDLSQSLQFSAMGINQQAWTWNFGDGTQSNLQNPSHQYLQSGSYQVSLIVQAQNGCVDTVYLSQNIIVKARTSFTLSSNTQSDCVPFPVVFNAFPKMANYSYDWDFGNGVIAVGDSALAMYREGGDYTVKLKLADQLGCKDSVILPNFINALGQKNASFQIDSLAMCSQGNIQFQNKSPLADQVKWFFGDGDSSTQKNPIHSYPTVGNYNLIYQVIDSNACTFDTSLSLNIQNLSPQISSSDTTGCPPLLVQFSGLVPTQNISQWHWDFGDGDTSSLASPTHIYHIPGTYDVKLKIENSRGCVDSVIYNSFIQVNSDTIWEAQADTVLACATLPVQLDGSSFGSNGWIWDFGNGDTLHGAQVNYSYQLPGVYTISLQTQNGMGCVQHYQNYLTVAIDSLIPKAKALHFDCQNGIIQLSDSTLNGVSWFWDFGDGTFSTLQSPTHQYSISGLYNISLTVTNSKGCSQSTFFPGLVDLNQCKLNGIPLDPSSLPPIVDPSNPITGNLPLAHLCAPQLVQFANPDSSANSWFWDFGDGNHSTTANPSHMYQNPGLYTVQLIYQNNSITDTIIWNNLVKVNGPVADFTSQVFFACDSVNLQSTDLSSGANFWDWKMGARHFQNQSVVSNKFAYGTLANPVLLQVKDSVGCQSSKLKVYGFPKMDLQFTLPDSICLMDTLMVFSPDTNTLVHWDFGDGTFDSSIHAGFHRYTKGGNYIVRASYQVNGCYINHIVDTVFVRELNSQFQIVDSALCQNQKFQFLPADLNADAYLWRFGPNWISKAKTPHLQMGASGKFAVELNISKYGCTQKSFSSDSILVKPIYADFDIIQTTACSPYAFQLVESNNLTRSWEWLVDSIYYSGQDSLSLSTTDSLVSIQLKINNAMGCRDSVQKDFIPQSLQADFSVSKTSLCKGDSVVFSNLTKLANQYIWDFGDGDTSHAFQPIKTYTQAGDYTVKLIAIAGTSCTDTLVREKLIHVSGLKANFSVNYISTCAPMLVNFIDSSRNAITWHWKFGNGLESGLRNPVELYDNTGHYDVGLWVTDSLGCSDSLIKQNEVLVPGPIAKFSMNDSLLCGPQTVQFIDSSTQATQYHWLFGDGATSSAVNPTHHYQQKGEFQVSLIASDASGCSGYFIHPNKIKMDDKPVADFQLLDSTACTPFLPNIINQSQAVDYWLWETGTGISLTDSTFNHSYLQAGHYQIKLYVENSLGCRDSLFADSITVHQSKNATIVPLSSICENLDSIQIQSQSAGGYWLGSGFADSLSGNYFPSLASVGLDSIFYIQEGICSDRDTLLLNIKEAPKADFYSDIQESCEEVEITLEAQQLPYLLDSSTVNYSWKANGVQIGSQRKLLHYFNPSIYDIELELNASNGCSDREFKAAYIRVFDSIPPESDLLNVTVVDDYSIAVNWPASNDLAFDHYELYRKNPSDSSYNLIYQSTNPTDHYFLDNQVEPKNDSYQYKIRVMDVCGKQIDLNQVAYHKSIWLTTTSLNAHKVQLNWNGYEGDSVIAYEVYRKIEGKSSYQLLLSLNASTLQYIDTSTYCSGIYKYRIKARLNQMNSSWSNQSAAVQKGLNPTNLIEIKRVSVLDNKAIEVEWDTLSQYREMALGYTLHRSANGKMYLPIHYFGIGDFYYLDQGIDPQVQSYSYKIELMTDCPVMDKANVASSSIHLRKRQIGPSKGELFWTPYQGWSAGPKEYQIQKLNENQEWETIQKLAPNRHSTEIHME